MSFFSMVMSLLPKRPDGAPHHGLIPWFFRRFLIQREAMRRRRLVRALDSTLLPEDGRGRRYVPPTTLRSSTHRAVPTPVRALTALLNRHPQSRSTFRHLHIVETTLMLSKVTAFDNLPLRILEQAVRQLEQLGAIDDGSALDILHLQMRRKVGELQARQAAARHAASLPPAAAAARPQPAAAAAAGLLVARDSQLMFDGDPPAAPAAGAQPDAPSPHLQAATPAPGGSLIERAMLALQEGDARYVPLRPRRTPTRRRGDVPLDSAAAFADTMPMSLEEIEPRRLRA